MLREPAVAGTFYPANLEDIKIAIEESFLSPLGLGEIPKIAEPYDNKVYPVNVMVPHAGYIYSGPVASYSYGKLAKIGFPKTFIIICPNHTGIGSSLSIFNKGKWKTPLGNVDVDEDFADAILSFSEFGESDLSAHIQEHSIEVQLPFLQYFSNDFEIVPINMGLQDLVVANDLAKSIVKASNEIGKSYCIIASTDLSHFNNQEKANRLDKLVLKDIENMDEKKLFNDVTDNQITMCGYGPVITTILTSKLTGKNQCNILAYNTSGDITGDFSSVVGYGSGIFK